MECLHHLFEAQAAARPDSAALMCGFRTMTYRELDQQANQLARHLRVNGVARGKLVGLLLERSADICVAILAVLKCGAAYVPLDRDYPDERIFFILQDCKVDLVLTHSRIAKKHSPLPRPLLTLDSQPGSWVSESTAALARDEIGVSPADLCYIIYTSGTTGDPKGVQIEHGSAVNFVRGALTVYGVNHKDRIYQGFSIAFDASVEEIWLAFASGATLVAGTSEKIRSGAAVAELLTEHRVTVFSCVPTFLSLIDRDLPKVRLLILGGEQCPPDLIARWFSPRRRILNTYGPTEATVVATWAECRPDKPITIGKPLPNYSVVILDEQRLPVSTHEIGELYIGGACLARGYVNQPELTRQKFIEGVDLPASAVTRGRYYRTGDLVRMLDSGEIEFIGRADGQVKIRGFRVELSEIESTLLRNEAVQAAAAGVHTIDGIQNLVGYLVPRPDRSIDIESLAIQLRARLPPYMVPTYLEIVSDLPTLPSGKMDRKRLPLPKSTRLRSKGRVVAPQSEMERQLSAGWQEVFGAEVRISTDDDFFLDLGGHSHLAARLISLLRRHSNLGSVSVVELYQNPTISRLAKKLEADAARSRLSEPSSPPTRRPNGAAAPRTRLCGLLQFLSLAFMYASAGLGLAVAVQIIRRAYETGQLGLLIWLLSGMILAALPVGLAYNFVLKRVLIGRYRAGRFPIWGFYYFRFWLLAHLSIPTRFLAGTPLMPLYCRLMGARIGRGCFIDTSNIRAYDLLSVGDDTSINADAHLEGYSLDDGFLTIGPVKIGSQCFIGAQAVLGVHTQMGDTARLDDLSSLEANTAIAAGEAWRGSPRARAAMAFPTAPRADPTKLQIAALGLAQTLAILVTLAIALAAWIPSLLLVLIPLTRGNVPRALLLLPLAALMFVSLFCAAIVIAKIMFVGRTKAGSYSTFGRAMFSQWFLEQLMLMSRSFVHTLYATLYLPHWLRALGAKIGKRTEVSTISHLSPDLLIIGRESFIADSAFVGSKRVYRNELKISETQIGRRSFIGNGALIPGAVTIGDSCLIGCLSRPSQETVPTGTSWLGSPSFVLPKRQQDYHFPETSLYSPPASALVGRLAVDLLRILLPQSYYLLSFAAFFAFVWRKPLSSAMWSAPLVSGGLALAGALLVVALKWIVVGRFKPGAYPLWSPFVWFNELVTGAYESIAVPMIVNPLLGTPFLAFFMRLLGAKFGRAVCCETPFFTEFDLVSVGEGSCLNASSTMQTHLFEDRVLKMSHLEVGSHCTVGNLSIVLYDTRMGDRSKLGALSLLMKGEILPPSTDWFGIPSRAESPPQLPVAEPSALAS